MKEKEKDGREGSENGTVLFDERGRRQSLMMMKTIGIKNRMRKEEINCGKVST